jgi:hypothetical protein
MVQRHLFLLLLFLAFNTQAQIQGGGGKGHYFPENGWEKVPLISFPSPDIVALRHEDRVLDSLGDHPWRFGYNHSTFVNSEFGYPPKTMENFGCCASKAAMP